MIDLIGLAAMIAEWLGFAIYYGGIAGGFLFLSITLDRAYRDVRSNFRAWRRKRRGVVVTRFR